MEIIEFNEAVFQKIKTKKICLVEKSAAYLEELSDTFDLLSNIIAIVDENPKKYGSFLYKGLQMTVNSLEYLQELNLDETIILVTSDYYREYIVKLEKLLLGKVKKIYIFFNRETRIEKGYRDQYKAAELEDIIVFRSGPHNLEYVRGMDFSDNARALFEYMLSVKLNEKYELVWFVKYPEEYVAYKAYDNVSFIAYDASVSEEQQERDSYYRALCLARFLFFTDAYGFARNCRKDQIRVQLWHGCGYKMRLNNTPCEKRYEYMTVTSKIYADIHAKAFGLRREQILVTGCAKQDWLFQESKALLNKLGILGTRKYIFWLPTYRFSNKCFEKPKDGDLSTETGLPLISSRKELNLLNEIMTRHNMLLLIKLHPFQDKEAVHCKGLSNIFLVDNELLIQKDIQVNQLLSMADALISDYSSAAVDYLLLDRPIGFVVNDRADYASNRGFVFEDILEWLPGKCIFKTEDLIDFMEEISHDKDSGKAKRRRIRRLFHKNADGENCRRIVESLGILSCEKGKNKNRETDKHG